MTISLKHAFTSAVADSGDTTLVQPSNWNAEHTLTLATSRLLGRTTAGTGAAEEISAGTGLSLSAGSLSISTVPVANGGTGATTANAGLTGLTTLTSTATAAGTTVLDNTSTYFQLFTGTSTQTITLPVTSTLATGWTFHIINNSTGNLTVNSSGGNLVITVLPGTTAMVTCIGTTLTTAADWESGLTDFSTATGTGSVVLSASPTITGALTLTGGTVTASAPVIDLSQTWNNAAVTFTGIKANVTDTASAAASLLMDLQVNSAGRFRVTKAGSILLPAGNNSAFAYNGGLGAYNFVGANNYQLYAGIDGGSGPIAFLIPSGSSFAFNSTNNLAAQTQDTFLTRRGAANLRFGAADAAAPVAQTLSVQSVATGNTDGAGQNFTITGSQGTGTGAGGSIIFQVAPAGTAGTAQNALSTALTIASDRSVTFASGFTANAGSQVSNNLVVTGELLGGSNLRVGTTGAIYWNGNNVVLTNRGVGNLRFGSADAAAPVAQTLSVQSVVAGTSNTAGQDLTITGSQPTGTGTAGNIVLSTAFSNAVGTATVTITIATPAVVTWTAHGLVTGSPVVFTTTGALPTGITAGTTYYAITSSTLGANTFQIATSVANAQAGTAVATSGTQSGTHTGTTSATVQGPLLTTATLGPAGLTGSQSTSLVNLTQNWNTSGTPTAIKLNVNDTASNASSLLMDLQTGGTSRFKVDKAGVITSSSNIISGGNFQALSSGTVSWSGRGTLTSQATGNVQIGSADAASPSAQTLSAQSVVAGTTNAAGQDFTIRGSRGTGTGAGGAIVFQTAPAGASGTTQNAATERLRITSVGEIGIGGANYGTSGQVLTSGGSGAAPSWQWTINASSTTSITSPLAWNSGSFGQYAATAQATALTINADAGTPVDGRKEVFRFKDNGTARVLTFTGGVTNGFRPVGVTMTASGSNWTYTTTISKITYFGCVYNASDSRWDVVAISQEA
jgi:hypothetical protein